MADDPVTPIDSPILNEEDSTNYSLSLNSDLDLVIDIEEDFDLDKVLEQNMELENQLIGVMRSLNDARERYLADKDVHERLKINPSLEDEAQTEMIAFSMEVAFKDLSSFEKQRQKLNDEREVILSRALNRIRKIKPNSKNRIPFLERKLSAIQKVVNIAYDPTQDFEEQPIIQVEPVAPINETEDMVEEIVEMEDVKDLSEMSLESVFSAVSEEEIGETLAPRKPARHFEKSDYLGKYVDSKPIGENSENYDPRYSLDAVEKKVDSTNSTTLPEPIVTPQKTYGRKIFPGIPGRLGSRKKIEDTLPDLGERPVEKRPFPSFAAIAEAAAKIRNLVEEIDEEEDSGNNLQRGESLRNGISKIEARPEENSYQHQEEFMEAEPAVKNVPVVEPIRPFRKTVVVKDIPSDLSLLNLEDINLFD